MNTYIDCSPLFEKKKSRCVCHLMPCEIHHTGDVPVSKFFEPVIRKSTEDENILEASFRGRPLRGQVVQLPNAYTGVVLQKNSGKEDNLMEGANGEEEWSVQQQFDEFTVWNWDKIPSHNDKLQQALVWLDLANAIHSLEPKSDGDS